MEVTKQLGSSTSFSFKANHCLFKSDYLIIYTSNLSRNVFIITKKDIKKAVKRVRMKRKVRYILNKININYNVYFKVIIKKFFDFDYSEYKRIENKIITNVAK